MSRAKIGVCAGYPTIGVKATLIDAAYHDTGSSTQTFAIAAHACLREGTTKAGPQILGPIMRIEVTTPEGYAGDVIADLNSRRATRRIGNH
jgi:elongation factor G